jgi:DNA-binding protein HU-beta
MNRRELVRAVAAHTSEDAKHVESVLSGVTDVITAVVAKGEAVTIQGFAKFAKVERAARMGRNPRTGEQIRIKASKRVRVSPMKAFKDTVMSGQAPRLMRGVWPTSPELLTKQAAERRAGSRAATAPAKKAPAARTTAAKKAVAKKAVAKKAATRRAPAKATAAKKAPRTTRRPAPAKKTTKRAARR